jgi:Flagellar protein YcgR/PilZ domain
MKDPRKRALEAFARDFGNTRQRSRMAITVSPGDSKQSYLINVLGVIPGPRYLIVSAPTTVDGSLIAVQKGQVLHCRWLNSSSAFKFEATIVRISFEPVPLLYVLLADRISKRAVRNVPRALASFPAVVRTTQPITGLLVDLSVTGARFAAYHDQELRLDQSAELSFKPRVLDHDYLLTINCKIASVTDHPVADHPDIMFYGIQFHELPQTDLLVLQCCVQACLTEETDFLAQVLLESEEVTATAE